MNDESFGFLSVPQRRDTMDIAWKFDTLGHQGMMSWDKGLEHQKLLGRAAGGTTPGNPAAGLQDQGQPEQHLRQERPALERRHQEPQVAGPRPHWEQREALRHQVVMRQGLHRLGWPQPELQESGPQERQVQQERQAPSEHQVQPEHLVPVGLHPTRRS